MTAISKPRNPIGHHLDPILCYIVVLPNVLGREPVTNGNPVNAFRAVIGSYPGIDLLGETILFEAPYYALAHHRDALSRYRIAQPPSHNDEYAATTAKHIGVLLDFLDKSYGDRIREEEVRHRRSTPVATCDWLWLLFKPGEVVYKELHNIWVPFIIDRVVHNYARDGGLRRYEVECWGIHFSEGKMRRYTKSFDIMSFSGEQPICSLEVIPATFFPEDLGKQGGLPMAERQIAMGKLYWELAKRPAYKEHDGQVVMRNGEKTGYVSYILSMLFKSSPPSPGKESTCKNNTLTSPLFRTLGELSSMQKAMIASPWARAMGPSVNLCRQPDSYHLPLPSDPLHSSGRTVGAKHAAKNEMTAPDHSPTLRT